MNRGRSKRKSNAEPIENGVKKRKTENGEASIKPVTKCNQCGLRFDDPGLKVFPGVPNGVEELVALVDPKLSWYTDNDDCYDGSLDNLPLHKLTGFCLYDRNKHFVAIDSGLIEGDKEVFASGHVKPVFDEDPSIEGGITTVDLGPIVQWDMSAYDGGENDVIFIITSCAQYALVKPMDTYAPYMDAIYEKIHLSQLVLRFVSSEPDSDYSELLNHIQTSTPPPGLEPFTEESLLRHAPFVIDRVASHDANRNEADEPLMDAESIKNLVNLVGPSVNKKPKKQPKVPSAKKPVSNTLATTTPLVRHVFETLFADQICRDATEETKVDLKKKRCMSCEDCQQPDCGDCVNCRKMSKFGGSSNTTCLKRSRCPNMKVSDNSDEDEDDGAEEQNRKLPPSRKGTVKAIGKPKSVARSSRKYYSKINVRGEIINTGDFVLVEPDDSKMEHLIAKCVYFFEEKGNVMFHAHWLSRSCETILGETGDPNELFLTLDCQDVIALDIFKKCDVDAEGCRPSPGWRMEGGVKDSIKKFDSIEDGNSFFLQKSYDIYKARFEDIPPEFDVTDDSQPDHCISCEALEKSRQFVVPRWGARTSGPKLGVSYYESIKWEEVEYRVGDCVYLISDAYAFNYTQEPRKMEPLKDLSEIDEEKYPEYYRKNLNVKSSISEVHQPFKIAVITKIFEKVVENKKKDQRTAPIKMLRINKFYRPEDTHKGMTAAYESDNNLLYWSAEETSVPFDAVEGKCYVVFVDNLNESVDNYSDGGPDRFYFEQQYDWKSQKFSDPPVKATNMGARENVATSSKLNGKPESDKTMTIPVNFYEEKAFPTLEDKLVSLDIFAGCGGLTEGFHQAGVAEPKWAIEKDSMAAKAFKNNFPDCHVFTEDCNDLLKSIMEGKKVDNNGRSLPSKGDVQLLCGGPPCQGFSGMNRFNSGQYSRFKNSLIVTFLSYVDYFRPRFAVMENVRNFVSFKKAMVLKLTLSCLVKMGYQVAFMIMQAGSFGVPQTRRRLILIAAAPGEQLPNFPQPTHVFASRGSLTLAVNGRKYDFSAFLRGGKISAPLRTITVRDAISDLPKLKNGTRDDDISYNGEPVTQYQKKMRGDGRTLRDHICKEMSALVEARIRHIPTTRGSDWRDLPNIEVKLSNGKVTKKLVYKYADETAPSDRKRGVCPCSKGNPCNPADRQDNTLIPWCLPHTANRHNNWSGLYGRLDWDGIFKTTDTNPEPMGKQGCVLHPVDDRVVTVRECARSQGFPDQFTFTGTVLDRHRQIGNAVPPPLAKAIGKEILLSLTSKDEF